MQPWVAKLSFRRTWIRIVGLLGVSAVTTGLLLGGLSILASDRLGVPIGVALAWITGVGVAVFGLGSAVAWSIARQTAREVDQATCELAESQQRYRALFDLAPDSIMLLRPRPGGQPEIIDANRATAEMHGYSDGELIGMPIGSLDAPSAHPHIDGRTRRLLAGETITFEAEHVRRDGTTFPVEVIAKLVRLGGEPVIQAIDRDISERRQAEAQRQKMQDQLRQSQKLEAIGQLGAGVAHDMNNILAAVMGAVSVLRKGGVADPELPAVLDSISGACRRGRELTRNLLGFAHKGPYVKERVSLHGVVREVRALLGRTVPHKITLVTELDAVQDTVEADLGQVSQAVMNICLNAVTALNGAGEVLIRSREREVDAEDVEARALVPLGRYVELQIVDRGVGMDARTLEHATEPFFTTKPVGQGTGLGLSMAYGTLRNSGGALHIDSAPGRGTTVSLLFPLASGQARAPEASEAPTAEAPRGEGHVLVVDDEDLIRWSLKALLESLGYTVITAADGREAVDAVHRHGTAIDVVVLDMTMPFMDGPETFDALRHLQPDLPILLSSGYAKGQEVEALLARGATCFVEKPADLEVLAARVAEITARRR